MASENFSLRFVMFHYSVVSSLCCCNYNECKFITFFFIKFFFRFFLLFKKKIFYLKKHLNRSLSGGIGRRARLKLVFFGVWVRFPPQVQKQANSLAFFILLHTQNSHQYTVTY